MRIVGGRWRGLGLIAPEGQGVRPTGDRARQALFNILQHAAFSPVRLEGAIVADIFCGTGALAIEAVSRGAASAVLLDRDVAPARANLRKVKEPDLFRLMSGDGSALPAAPVRADLVFIDPPYHKGLVAPCLVGLVSRGWLAEAALVVAETAADETLEPPGGFELLDERRYGAARLWFLGWGD
jgi:16S rRNA (guanine966-N2)-methyltransferase